MRPGPRRRGRAAPRCSGSGGPRRSRPRRRGGPWRSCRPRPGHTERRPSPGRCATGREAGPPRRWGPHFSRRPRSNSRPSSSRTCCRRRRPRKSSLGSQPPPSSRSATRSCWETGPSRPRAESRQCAALAGCLRGPSRPSRPASRRRRGRRPPCSSPPPAQGSRPTGAWTEHRPLRPICSEAGCRRCRSAPFCASRGGSTTTSTCRVGAAPGRATPTSAAPSSARAPCRGTASARRRRRSPPRRAPPRPGAAATGAADLAGGSQ
mmetsp:Transcript_14702/g.43963  ORF Transcript_14702/g.43963 Transcript_14702/m.43963 type:complete len:264 (+) Transcript_14702:427-1218(+)